MLGGEQLSQNSANPFETQPVTAEDPHLPPSDSSALVNESPSNSHMGFKFLPGYPASPGPSFETGVDPECYSLRERQPLERRHTWPTVAKETTDGIHR